MQTAVKANSRPATRFPSPCPDPDQKLACLKVVIPLAMIASLAVCWRLWTSSRLFPLTPVIAALPAIPSPFDKICLAIVLALAMATAFLRWPQKLVLLFVAAVGLLSLWDQERWQPWFFLYFFIIAVIGWREWRGGGERKKELALNSCRLMIASVYFWSGLQKLNANFINETWPEVSAPLFKFLPVLEGISPRLVLLAALLEVAIGIGLLTRKYRNVAAILAIGTHVLILVVLVASGENPVVWPWNIAMGLLVVVLFWQERQAGAAQILRPRNAIQAFIALLFMVMPLFSFFDLWDSYLSDALYSRNADQAVIYVSAEIMEQLPARLHPYIWRAKEPYFLDINRWSYGELNVPVYPEPRVFRSVAREVCSLAGEAAPGQVMLRILGKPNLLTGRRRSEFYDCEHVM